MHMSEQLIVHCLNDTRCDAQAVIEEIVKKEHVPVRVNGPMGGESILSENYDQLLLIAGGAGVRPAQRFQLFPLF